jgi:hypothetical protein
MSVFVRHGLAILQTADLSPADASERIGLSVDEVISIRVRLRGLRVYPYDIGKPPWKKPTISEGYERLIKTAGQWRSISSRGNVQLRSISSRGKKKKTEEQFLEHHSKIISRLKDGAPHSVVADESGISRQRVHAISKRAGLIPPHSKLGILLRSLP